MTSRSNPERSPSGRSNAFRLFRVTAPIVEGGVEYTHCGEVQAGGKWYALKARVTEHTEPDGTSWREFVGVANPIAAAFAPQGAKEGGGGRKSAEEPSTPRPDPHALSADFFSEIPFNDAIPF